MLGVFYNRIQTPFNQKNDIEKKKGFCNGNNFEQSFDLGLWVWGWQDGFPPTETNKPQARLPLCQVASRGSETVTPRSVFWTNARISACSLPAICRSHHRWSSGCQNKLELNTASNHQIQYVHPSLSGLDRRPNMGTDCSSQDVIGVRKWAENNIADPLCHEYNLSPQAVSTACLFFSPKHQTLEGNSFFPPGTLERWPVVLYCKYACNHPLNVCLVNVWIISLDSLKIEKLEPVFWVLVTPDLCFFFYFSCEKCSVQSKTGARTIIEPNPSISFSYYNDGQCV